MESDFISWFVRSLGDWQSYRRYLFGNQLTPELLETSFEMTQTGDNTFLLTWGSAINTGEMNFTINGDSLERDRGYYTDEPTTSKMKFIDRDTVEFTTYYGGINYREEIRLLHGDCIRLRQTIGTKNNKINIVGQYYETRL